MLEAVIEPFEPVAAKELALMVLFIDTVFALMFEVAMFDAVTFEDVMEPFAPVATNDGAVTAPDIAAAPTTSKAIPDDGADFPIAKFAENAPKAPVTLLANILEPMLKPPVEAFVEILVFPILMVSPLSHKSRKQNSSVPKSYATSVVGTMCPATAKPFNVPTLVIKGCAAVFKVPVRLVAVSVDVVNRFVVMLDAAIFDAVTLPVAPFATNDAVPAPFAVYDAAVTAPVTFALLPTRRLLLALIMPFTSSA